MHPGKSLTRKKKKDDDSETAVEGKTTTFSLDLSQLRSVPVKFGKKAKI